jgi:hypothetical protein
MVGIAIGYVLGARAGRPRYEQIKRWAAEMRRHPAVRQLTDQLGGVTDLARQGVAAGLRAGSDQLRTVADDSVIAYTSGR